MPVRVRSSDGLGRSGTAAATGKATLECVEVQMKVMIRCLSHFNQQRLAVRLDLEHCAGNSSRRKKGVPLMSEREMCPIGLRFS